MSCNKTLKAHLTSPAQAGLVTAFIGVLFDNNAEELAADPEQLHSI